MKNSLYYISKFGIGLLAFGIFLGGVRGLDVLNLFWALS
jgi:hypothetical protein